MSVSFDINMNNQSSYSLSFVVDMGKINSSVNGKDQCDNFLENESIIKDLPKNTLFNISSILFNIEYRREEIISNYQCYYKPQEESFCIIIDENSRCSDFSKEMMLNLLEFGQKLKVRMIYLLICRKSQDYVKLLQGMMTIGFEHEIKVKIAKLQGKKYKILKMYLSPDFNAIEEIEF